MPERAGATNTVLRWLAQAGVTVPGRGHWTPLIGDLEPAVTLAGDRPGPQPALIGAAGFDVRAIPIDDVRVGHREP